MSGREPETVTILFTDIVGSTAFRARHGDRQADALRRDHDRVVSRAVESQGGTLVKGTGDGALASFPAAASALRAALDLQRAVARRNASLEHSSALLVRIGLSVGDVIWEGGDCHGSPVIEAARLCDAAGGGEILLSAAVRAMAHSRADFHFDDRGERELKGLREPLATLALTWRDDRPRRSLPPMLVADDDATVGRERELDQLRTAWRIVLDAGARVVAVTGEPGIGKSQLVREAATEVHGAGSVVMAGHCDAQLEIPYGPFAELLRDWVADVGEGPIELGSMPGELAGLVPELRSQVDDLPPTIDASPETQRYRLYEAVASWLVAVAQQSPLVIVLEDLHWATRPTLQLLRHVALSAAHAPILFLVTYRPGDVSTPDPVLAAVGDLGEDRFSAVGLTGLETSDLVRWFRAAAGHDLDERAHALAGVLQRETAGNPLFVRELLRHLIDTDQIVELASASTEATDLSLPASVREAVRSRLERLDRGHRSILEVGAVAGHAFAVSTLRAALSLPDLELADALDELTRVRLISTLEPGRWSFTHALVRGAVYSELGEHRRMVLHQRVAEALEQEGVSRPAELAHHWMAAAPLTGSDRGIQRSIEAGAEAGLQFAWDDAARHFRRAVDAMAEDDTAFAHVLLRLGDAQRRAGDPAYRTVMARLADVARRRHDVDLLTLAALGSGRPTIWYAQTGNVDRALVELYEEALAALGPTACVERAQLLVYLALELYWSDERTRRLALARESLALARELGDDCMELILGPYVLATWDPASRADRQARIEELELITAGRGTLEGRFLARFLRAVSLMEDGRLADAEAELELTGELADELHEPLIRWRYLTRRAALALRHGPDVGEAVVLEALDLGQRSGQPDALSVFGAQYFVVAWDRGTLGDLASSVEAFIDSMPGIPAWRAVLALLQVEVGDLEAAAQQFELAAGAECRIRSDSTWMVGMALLGEVCAALGDQRRAALIYEQLVPFAGGVVDVVHGLATLGSVDRTLGLLAACLGQRGLADAHFATALETDRRNGHAAFAVRTRRDHASSLADWGERSRGLELARPALDDAEALGMQLDVQRLKRLVRRLEATAILS